MLEKYASGSVLDTFNPRRGGGLGVSTGAGVTPAGPTPASNRAAQSLRYAPSFIIGEEHSPESAPVYDGDARSSHPYTAQTIANLLDGPSPTAGAVGSYFVVFFDPNPMTRPTFKGLRRPPPMQIWGNIR